jgi:hypothetical protein
MGDRHSLKNMIGFPLRVESRIAFLAMLADPETARSPTSGAGVEQCAVKRMLYQSLRWVSLQVAILSRRTWALGIMKAAFDGFRVIWLGPLICLILFHEAAAQAQTLAEALNTTNLTWTTSGNAEWFGQTNVTHDGIAAVQSGLISVGQSSRLQTIVAGPGTLSFWWRQTSTGVLSLLVGGVEQSTLSGATTWQQQIIYLGTGTQSLEWITGQPRTQGQDSGWVDQVNYTPGAAVPVFKSQPRSQTSAPGLTVTFSAKVVGTPPVSYQWQFRGTNIPGAHATSLSVTNLQVSDQGNYRV